jgi:hypothetical protein
MVRMCQCRRLFIRHRRLKRIEERRIRTIGFVQNCRKWSCDMSRLAAQTFTRRFPSAVERPAGRIAALRAGLPSML